jgi:hypothetical protein
MMNFGKLITKNYLILRKKNWSSTEVPKGYLGNEQLYNWVLVQRAHFNGFNGKVKRAARPMSSHRIKVLNNINFEWNLSNKYDRKWMVLYHELVDYSKKKKKVVLQMFLKDAHNLVDG